MTSYTEDFKDLTTAQAYQKTRSTWANKIENLSEQELEFFSDMANIILEFSLQKENVRTYRAAFEHIMADYDFNSHKTGHRK